MEQEYNDQSSLNSIGLSYKKSFEQSSVGESEISSPDPQVKASGAPNRKFTVQYKQKIAYDACKNSLERGELLRGEGLYSTHISSWKRLFKPDSESKKESSKTQRIDHLVNEVTQLKKKLAQAQAIIDLQKKVSDLLGMHILPHDSNEGK